MKENEIKVIEIDLLIEAIFKRYGHNLRLYARASIERRLRQFILHTDFKSLSEMIPNILYDEEFFHKLISYISVPVTEMFRDPYVYRTLREKVIPILRTWPHIKIWHAGCATGEEVYSLAIVLKEEGIYQKAIIYATDFNDEVLARARGGIYEASKMKKASSNYLHAGGTALFSQYYHSNHNAVVMDNSLKERITFANHNLAIDQVFGEMHLIFCRNVIIYFNRELQNRTLTLLTESLVHGGLLVLGSKEDIQFTDVNDSYQVLDSKAKIYKKVVWHHEG